AMATLTASERPRLHAQVAVAMEQAHAADLAPYYADLAYHYAQAQHRAKAIFYLEKAGDSAQARYQNEEALAYFKQLLAWQPAAEIRLTTHLKQGQLLHFVGQYDEALSVLQTGLDLAQKTKRLDLAAQLHTERASLYYAKGMFAESLSSLVTAEALSLQLHNDLLHAQILSQKGRSYLGQGEHAAALDHAQQALTLFQTCGDKVGMVEASRIISFVYGEQDRHEDAIAYSQQALLLAEQMENQLLIAQILFVGQCLPYYRLGQYEQALEIAKRAVQIAQSIGWKMGLCMGLNNLGLFYLQLEHYEQALDHLQQGLTINLEFGNQRDISYAYSNIGVAYFEMGTYGEALDYLQRGLQLKLELKMHLTIGYNYGYMALCQTAQGTYDAVLQTAVAHFQQHQEIQFDHAAGLVHLALAQTLAARDAGQPWTATMHTLLASVTSLTQLSATPTAYFETALESTRQYVLIHALIAYAQFLMQLDQPEAARIRLQEAKEIAVAAKLTQKLNLIRS
ncbi:MAG: tetratricopeptide repeat protein, partial [bacterium]|nr:tetratricopeptide repeat protein [bacterium]